MNSYQTAAVIMPPNSNGNNNGNGASHHINLNTKTASVDQTNVSGTIQSASPAKRIRDLTNDDFEVARQHLEKKFILWGDFADIVQFGLMSNKNVIIFGKGGHGKSEMSEQYIKALGLDAFTQSCGSGLTEEKLFGGLNLKKFNDTGEIEYLVQNSFMNHEVIVFEELLDAPIHVLLSLKDILTSKRFRQGHQQFKIKTKFVLCLTNRSRAEVTEDNSIEAFMDRFPLEYEMNWKNYNASNYFKLVRKVVPQVDEDDAQLLADMFSSLWNAGVFISPRTAVHASELFHNFGIASLRFLQGIDQKVIDAVKKDVEAKKAVRDLKNAHTKLMQMQKDINGIDVSRGNPVDNKETLVKFLGEMGIVKNDLTALKVTGKEAEDKLKVCMGLIKDITAAAALKINAVSDKEQNEKKNPSAAFNALSSMMKGRGGAYEEEEKEEEEDELDKAVKALPQAAPTTATPAAQAPTAMEVIAETEDSKTLDMELDEVINEYAKTKKVAPQAGYEDEDEEDEKPAS